MCRKTDSMIIENDSDSEFCYNGFLEKSLYELDSEHVIYVGTFAKLLFPFAAAWFIWWCPGISVRSA